VNKTNIIKSTSYNQHKILKNIIVLHCPDGFECDVTYGKGNFYKDGVSQPRLRFDIEPRLPEVIAADCRKLPLMNDSINSVIFDPPFMARTGPGASLKKCFGELVGTIKDLWQFYYESMEEIYRVLKFGGILVFKCQDGVLSGVNNFTHVVVHNMATDIGFRPIDLFILLAKHRMNHPKHTRQLHARKYHSYFWIFKKRKINVARW